MIKRVAIVRLGDYFVVRKGWIDYQFFDKDYKGGKWWDNSGWATLFKTPEEAEAAYRKYKASKVVKWI